MLPFFFAFKKLICCSRNEKMNTTFLNLPIFPSSIFNLPTSNLPSSNLPIFQSSIFQSSNLHPDVSGFQSSIFNLPIFQSCNLPIFYLESF